MIAVDTNILVHAHREDSGFHTAAYAAIAQLAEQRAPWGIPWPSLHEFFAIATHPRIYAPPTPVGAAIEQIEAWLESPTLVLLAESEQHWPVLRETITRGGIAGPAVHDARIAALCQQHGVRELWTADRDFSRFAAVRVRNPLVS